MVPLCWSVRKKVVYVPRFEDGWISFSVAPWLGLRLSSSWLQRGPHVCPAPYSGLDIKLRMERGPLHSLPHPSSFISPASLGRRRHSKIPLPSPQILGELDQRRLHSLRPLIKLEIPSFGARLASFSPHGSENSPVSYPLSVQSPVDKILGV